MGKTNEKKNNIYRLSKNTHKRNSFSILLAEDDKEMRSLLALMLKKGFQVCECTDGLSLLDMLSSFFLPSEEHENFDLIISDIRMPGVTGMEILMGANELDNFPPIILITAFGNKETHMQAELLGAVALFDKPFDIDDMLKKVRTILVNLGLTGIDSVNCNRNLQETDMVKQEHGTPTVTNHFSQDSYYKRSPLRILLAEDDLEMRRMLSWYLQKKGYGVVVCKDGNELMRHLGFFGPLEYFHGFDLIISDIRMPGATGLQVLGTAKEFDDFPPMILITAFPDKQTLELAKRLEATAILLPNLST